ncbi:MAG: 50S ribosomal protein L18 [Acidobacteria bacterium]|nr:50S ribosomal protein L18 [Acidobacteriota bacterium]
MRFKSANERRQHVKKRIRKKVNGNANCPRLAVYKSLNHIYVQAIDDKQGVTLAAASTLDSNLKEKVKFGGNVAAAKQVGTLIAERLLEKKIDTVVFDRGGYVYHGRIKALADAAREKGLKF